jgi:hypothetical protein
MADRRGTDVAGEPQSPKAQPSHAPAETVMTGTREEPGLTRSGRGPSDRAFGLTFATVLGLVAFWPVAVGGRGPRVWAMAAAGLFLAVAVLRPGLLAPVNRAWYKVGLFLSRATSPVILGLIFYGTVLPTGLVLRLLGRRPIEPRPDPERDSYWVHRDPPGPAPDTMTHPF